jgi:hypothetical protein
MADYCAHATLSSSNGLNLDRFFESSRQNAAILATDKFFADEKLVRLLKLPTILVFFARSEDLRNASKKKMLNTH